MERSTQQSTTPKEINLLATVLSTQRQTFQKHGEWIRMYEICKDRKILKEMGFKTNKSFADHLGFSETAFRQNRSKGRIFKELFQAGFAYTDMPQNTQSALALVHHAELVKKKERRKSVVDVWKASLILGGSANTTYEKHVQEASIDIPNTSNIADISAMAAAEKDNIEKISTLKDEIISLKKELEQSKKRTLSDDIMKI